MKTNAAVKANNDSVDVHTSGRVFALDGLAVRVATASGPVSARRARSCLVQPAVGDRVLVYLDRETAYVLAVLEGDSERAVTIGVDGDLSISLGSGALSVATTSGINLASRGPVSVVAPEVSLRARAGRMAFDSLAWVAGVVFGEVEQTRLVARSVDRIVERVTDKIKRSYRRVEELDQLDAENINWEARANMSVHCDNAIVTADNLVKFDAEQIHLG